MNIYKNAKVVFPDKIRDCVVICEKGKIVDITDRFDASQSDHVIDCMGQYLSPGFCDIHVHGGGKKSVMTENYQDIIAMANAHLKYGTTSIVPTTLASPIKVLENVTLAVKKASETNEYVNILGIHYEGPYISLKFKGAQQPENILNPNKCPPDELFEIWDKILMMGAAPEEDGCLELGGKLKNRGIVASVAHSAADYDTVKKAAQYGYSDVTHIYNACSTCFKRGVFRVAGVVEAGLALDEYTTQAIGDLKHLPAGLLNLIYKTKGDSKMYLITDGLEFSASPMEEGALYTQENGMAVVYEDGVMKLADRTALAGSAATLKDCVKNMYKTVGVPLYSAVKMASLTPATVVGAQNRKGQIKIGCDEDLLVFDDDINIKTIISGGIVI